MTQEEKAMAYDEAIKRSKEINNEHNDAMLKVFLELKESEDEKIRKDILAFIKREGQHIDKYEWHKWIAWLKKQGKQKPTNKVEPKFKVGDWVIHYGTENIYKVVAIIDNQYQLKYGDNYTVQNCADVDRCARLWDIAKDAKYGDVLSDKYDNIGIFQECEGICWHSYIYLGCDGELRGFNIGGSHEQTDTHPATKEQRDTLMKAMADAGYKLDSENKILLSLKAEPNSEQKPAEWSEEDEKCIRLSTDIIDSALRAGFCVQLDRDRCVDWLKSLKLKKQWKLSEEQMKALHDLNITGNISYVGQGQCLLELYNKLKEL